MATNLNRLAHKIESCTICSSRSRRPVQKILDTPSYTGAMFLVLLLSVYSADPSSIIRKNVDFPTQTRDDI
jgi:hypothetical protein